MAAPALKFLYLHCVDLGAMRVFYTDVLGFREIYFSTAERALAYDCDGLQFTIFEMSDGVAPEPADFAWQPGWVGGSRREISWSVPYEREDFDRTVAGIVLAGSPIAHSEPEWVGYWSFPVLDPMGNTVELACP